MLLTRLKNSNHINTGKPSTTDAIHTLNQIFQKSLIAMFVYFKQAYDSMKYNMVVKDVWKLEILNRLVR